MPSNQPSMPAATPPEEQMAPSPGSSLSQGQNKNEKEDDKDDLEGNEAIWAQYQEQLNNSNPLKNASPPSDSASSPSTSMMSSGNSGGFNQVSQMFNGQGVDPNQAAQFVAENPEVLAL